MINELKIFQRLALSFLKDEKENPVSKRIPTTDLHERLDLELSDEPTSEEAWEKAIKDIILATPKTASKLFFNQLFGGRQPKAAVGDLLAVLLNNSMHTYKVAGVQIGIEKEIINRCCEMINYGPNSGGTFPTGGSMSNFNGMLMGRDAFNDDIRHKGLQQKMIAYTSEDSHYSVSKNAAFIGIGRENVRKIRSDVKGVMIVEELHKQIEEDLKNGYAPFFVNATAGTTVLGAFDPIDKIADVCKEFNLWLHVDGAYYGSVFFSDRYRHHLKGVERADSFSFNAHKMLGTPVTCSILLVKDKKYLSQSFSNEASYLYQTDGDEYNLGKTSFQCGRRNDALKFWTLWKAVGTKGLANIVEHEMYLADVARDYVRNNADYTLYEMEDSTAICFNYKGIDAQTLCTSLYMSNELMVGYGNIKGKDYVRLVTINSNNSKEDILHLFKVIEGHVEAKFDVESEVIGK